MLEISVNEIFMRNYNKADRNKKMQKILLETSIDVEDFRPLNIARCICRVLERILRNAIYRYLIDNNTIHSF